VYVEGRLQIREYEDKDHTPRTSVEIVASRVRFLAVRLTRVMRSIRRQVGHGRKRRRMLRGLLTAESTMTFRSDEGSQP
jgi:single-stranded DNA-binding protein